MTHDLSDKTVLITGGAKRIGRVISVVFANAGANVVIHYNESADEAQKLAEQLKDIGVKAYIVQANLGIQDDVTSLIDRTYEIAGPLDILINNASIFPKNQINDVNLEDLHKNIDINAWAPFEISRQFVRKTNSGSIVNMLDSRIVGIDWNHIAYHASKYLLMLFTKMMAIEFAPSFTVNAVAPGLILPPEGKGQEYFEALKDRLPLKRIGSPEHVAEAVLFLACSEFITGEVIFVNGGGHLSEEYLGQNPH